MLEEKVLEQRYLDLKDDKGTRMAYIREDHRRDIDKGYQDRGNIHAPRCDLYTKQKYEFIKRQFLVSVPHTKGGNIVWNFVKDNITKEKDGYETIGSQGFYDKLFEEEKGGGIHQGLYGYHYLKHLILLKVGD